MDFAKLPEDIQFLVFKIITKIDTSYKNEWRGHLRLLSVCSHWRKLATPIVFNCLWVTYRDSKTPVTTNASLISSLEITKLVKQYNIDIRLDKAHSDLDPAIAVLKEYAPQWPRIKKLFINFDCFDQTIQDSRMSIGRYLNPINDTVRELVGILPSITSIHFGGRHPSQTCIETFKMIAGFYTKQIQQLSLHDAPIAGAQCYFKNITCLKASFDKSRISIPLCINASTLKHIALHHVNSDFSWTSFGYAPDAKFVKFPNLQTLNIDYGQSTRGHVVNGQCVPKLPYKLHFPQLRHLDLSPDCCSYPLLLSGIFSSGIHHLHVNATYESLKVLSKMKLPQIHILSLRVIVFYSDNFVESLEYISCVSNMVDRTADIEVVVNNGLQLNVPAIVGCSSLTKLVIKAPINYNDVLGIVSSQPQLVELKVDWFMFDETLPYSDYEMVEPVSQLNRLVFNYQNRHCPSMYGLEFLQHLLLCLPRLKMLVAPRVTQAQMQKFIAGNAPLYPHLHTINCLLQLGPEF